MKLNDIDLNLLSEDDLRKVCLKYNIVTGGEAAKMSKDSLLRETRSYILHKMEKYKSRPRSFSQPNIHNPIGSGLSSGSNEGDLKQINPRQRRMSVPSNPNLNVKSKNDPPRSDATYIRDRRMSMPGTPNEVLAAKEDHVAKQNAIQGRQEVKQSNALANQGDLSQFDNIGMYPSVERMIAIGDLHGDLNVTLQALRLAKVIPSDIFSYNVDKIRWTGGNTWVVQLGDQIDRCRPDDWEKNCIRDFKDVVEDEGNNMRIIQIFQKLDLEARKVGGRVLGLLGNHELMNIDKDYRYVSPEEFLEFVPKDQRTSKKTEDGYPLGYYHRLKAFERGGNIAKHYALQKKSILIVGRWLFVHGGISHALASKYTIPEINNVVKDWLLNKTNEQGEKLFDEIFRADDDLSPFWCRLYSEEDDEDENTLQGFNKLMSILNKRNETREPIDCVVVAHTPQFMNDRYLNSRYDERLWRVDVGMSRAFGQHDSCGENKYRQIQVLEIINNKKCIVHKAPYLGRERSEGYQDNVELGGERMPF